MSQTVCALERGTGGGEWAGLAAPPTRFRFLSGVIRARSFTVRSAFLRRVCVCETPWPAFPRYCSVPFCFPAPWPDLAAGLHSSETKHLRALSATTVLLDPLPSALPILDFLRLPPALLPFARLQ
jgi:hypothetical protein